jgi:hypothetical protein
MMVDFRSCKWLRSGIFTYIAALCLDNMSRYGDPQHLRAAVHTECMMKCLGFELPQQTRVRHMNFNIVQI